MNPEGAKAFRVFFKTFRAKPDGRFLNKRQEMNFVHYCLRSIPTKREWGNDLFLLKVLEVILIVTNKMQRIVGISTRKLKNEFVCTFIPLRGQPFLTSKSAIYNAWWDAYCLPETYIPGSSKIILFSHSNL